MRALACNICVNPSIHGLCLSGSSAALPCVSSYADDTSLIVCLDHLIHTVFSVFSHCERGLGAKLNRLRCKGLWLGSWNGHTDSLVDMEWTAVIVKVLGVFVGPGNVEEVNWRSCITVVENVLNSWRQQMLSYDGRACVINALALSCA